MCCPFTLQRPQGPVSRADEVREEEADEDIEEEADEDLQEDKVVDIEAEVNFEL